MSHLTPQAKFSAAFLTVRRWWKGPVWDAEQLAKLSALLDQERSSKKLMYMHVHTQSSLSWSLLFVLILRRDQRGKASIEIVRRRMLDTLHSLSRLGRGYP